MYSCGFFGNAGNYKGMGDSKIVPNLEVDQFDKIVRASKAFADDAATITGLWTRSKGPMFLLTARTLNLGLADCGITTYFSDNCTKEDADLVTEWMKLKKVEGYICRTFKTLDGDGRTVYDVKLASIERGDKNEITLPAEEFRGSLFKVTRGDYSKLLALVAEQLASAKAYAANDNEAQMLEHYIRSFTEGSLDEHKEGSR